MSAPQMMAACPKYDEQHCDCKGCSHAKEHEILGTCRHAGSRCPACTPLPAAEQHDYCRWLQDGDCDGWKTSCGHAYAINDGTPVENEMKFCTYCGKQIEQVVFSEEEDVEDEDAAEPPPRKTPRERISEARVLVDPFPSADDVITATLAAAERVIAAADAREDALREESKRLEREVAEYRGIADRVCGVLEQTRQSICECNIVDVPEWFRVCRWHKEITNDEGHAEQLARMICRVGNEIDTLRAQLATANEEHERLKRGHWKAEGEAHETPCTYGPLCPWCEVARLRDGWTNCVMAGQVEIARAEAAEQKAEKYRTKRNALSRDCKVSDAAKRAAEQKAANLSESLRVATEEVERLMRQLDEREADMHMRIRAGYDKTIADSWRAEVERATARAEAAEARIRELERIVAACEKDNTDWESEKRRERRERLDRMVEAEVAGAHGEGYVPEVIVGHAFTNLAATDAHMAQREEGR